LINGETAPWSVFTETGIIDLRLTIKAGPGLIGIRITAPSEKLLAGRIAPHRHPRTHRRFIVIPGPDPGMTRNRLSGDDAEHAVRG
jgi:hypothetical protein